MSKSGAKMKRWCSGTSRVGGTRTSGRQGNFLGIFLFRMLRSAKSSISCLLNRRRSVEFSQATGSNSSLACQQSSLLGVSGASSAVGAVAKLNGCLVTTPVTGPDFFALSHRNIRQVLSARIRDGQCSVLIWRFGGEDVHSQKQQKKKKSATTAGSLKRLREAYRPVAAYCGEECARACEESRGLVIFDTNCGEASVLAQPPIYSLLGQRGVFDVHFDTCAFG